MTIYDIYFLVPSIYEYLTITECFNLYQTCKEIRDLKPVDLWKKLILRDFNVNYSYYLERYQGTLLANTTISDMKYALGLDNFIICSFCKVINSNCMSTCIIKQNNISKTTCKKKYKLSDDELKMFRCSNKYNNYYRKKVTMYEGRDIKKYICDKYKGITNFIIKNQT